MCSQVDLSGASSSTASRDDLVDRARKLREQRELTQKRDEAAHKILSFWRGRRGVKQARQTQRQRFDAHLASSLLASSQQSGALPVTELALLVRRLLFFYRAAAPGDLDRLTKVVKLVSSSIRLQSASNNYCALVLTNQYQWIHQAKALSSLVLDQVADVKCVKTVIDAFVQFVMISRLCRSFSLEKVSGSTLCLYYLLDSAHWSFLQASKDVSESSKAIVRCEHGPFEEHEHAVCSV